jgi:hypothetical protein
MRRAVATFFYYFFSITPCGGGHFRLRTLSARWTHDGGHTSHRYKRTSPTAGLTLHHAMWLAAFPESERHQALLCVPMMAKDLLVDRDHDSLRISATFT